MARVATAAKEVPPIAAFAGFTPRLFDFFDGLAANQTREWFLDHKRAWDEDVRAPMGAFVESLALAFAAHDIPLTGSAERSLFRPNRDVRFSKDKRPYKTNAAAVLSRDGVKSGKGLFYISLGGHDARVERGGMIGAGFYAPEPADLAALRAAIAGAPERWGRVESDLAAAGLSLSRAGALSRIPKGFEAHAAGSVAETLKLKSLHVSQGLSAEALYAPSLIDEAIAFATAAMPLLAFGWAALGARPN